MQWYAVQVTTAHEKKVKKYLEQRKQNGLSDVIGEVVIPEKHGKPTISGYIFLQANVWPDFYLLSCNSKCNVLGTIPDTELKMLLSISDTEDIPAPKFKKGDQVIIRTGSLEGVSGIVERAGTRRSKISFFNGEVIVNAENSQLAPAEKSAPEAGERQN